MSVSMLLNSDDGPGADRSSRRDRENGRIPINSLLSRSVDGDLSSAARASGRHHAHTATSSHRNDTLHRQSSMYADRRAGSSSTRAQLPSLSMLHQSFHYGGAGVDSSGGQKSTSMDQHHTTSITNPHRVSSHSPSHTYSHSQQTNHSLHVHGKHSYSQQQQQPPYDHHQHSSTPHTHQPHTQHGSRRTATTTHTNTATSATKFAGSSGGKSLVRTKSVPYLSSPVSKNSSSATTNVAFIDSSSSAGGGMLEMPMSPASSSSSSHQHAGVAGGGSGTGGGGGAGGGACAGAGQGVNPPRRRWKPWEDQLLIQLVTEQGPQRWNTIAQGFPGRNGRQVRLRWMNHLQPSLDKRLWRPEEDAILLAAHRELGNKWALIAMRLHGRTDNSVKNRYKSIARRAARTAAQPLEK